MDTARIIRRLETNRQKEEGDESEALIAIDGVGIIEMS
jgi:hypothetical protein